MRTRSLLRLGSLAPTLLLACARPTAESAATADAHIAVGELLAADRHFASVARRSGAMAGIGAMLADDVTMPTSRGDFARGVPEATLALRAAFGVSRATAQWTPIRGGISADGRHGFTLGYMTLLEPDTASTPLKYLSYWVKGAGGWRVVAYRAGRRGAGDVSLAMLPPSLPSWHAAVPVDATTMRQYSASLIAAERAFSDRAQVVGLGPAFVENGLPDAVNMGGRDNASFVVGNEAIGRVVSGGSTQPGSPVSWSADRAIVASSGDMGVTFGVIRPNAPPAAGAQGTGFPFFTIWRRVGPTEPWRYVAE